MEYLKKQKNNNFIDSKKNIFSKFTIYFILIIIVSTSIHHHIWTKEKKVLYWDAISYYAYLPATFIYKDISLEFTQDYSGNHKFIFWPIKTKTDKLCIKTSMGVSILQLPFFLVGHLYAQNSNFDAGGYSQPYKLAMFICTLFWFIIGLIVLRKLLLKFFSDAVTAFTILIIGLGTNIYYYVIFEPIMSHQFNFTFFIFFIYLTISWYQKVTYTKSILLGIVIGMISLIRPTDSIIALFFVLYGVSKPKYIKKQILLFLKNYKQLFLIIFFAVIVWIPQMLYWKFISGHYLYFSYSNNEHFFWNNPHFIEGLFGYRKGWLVYTPVMIFSLIGIGFLKDTLNKFFLPIIVILPLNFYIIFSWWAWWYGGSFGMRPLIEYYSLLSIPIAAFIEWTLKQKKVQKIALLFFIITFSMYNLFATSQYTHGAIHWDGMTKEAYWDSFGRIHPSKKFWSLIEQPDYKAAKLGIDKPKK